MTFCAKMGPESISRVSSTSRSARSSPVSMPRRSTPRVTSRRGSTTLWWIRRISGLFAISGSRQAVTLP
jgi:hypothetical protein